MENIEFNEEEALNQVLKEKQSGKFSQEQVNAIVESAKKPTNAVRFETTSRVTQKLKTDDTIIERVDKTADALIDAGLTTIENEAQGEQDKSEADKLKTYFEKHKEELKTAGITEPTYMEDMERGVKAHRKWSDIHWKLCGWWMTGIRTMFMKAKPFKLILNLIAFTLSSGALVGIIIAFIKLIGVIK